MPRHYEAYRGCVGKYPRIIDSGRWIEVSGQPHSPTSFIPGRASVARWVGDKVQTNYFYVMSAFFIIVTLVSWTFFIDS